MRREPVDSSAILSVGYDPDTETLEVEFASGGVYEYHGVPRKVFQELMAAPSKGQFLAKRIRGQYESSKAE